MPIQKWNPAYTHFVEVDGKLASGWEYASDAKDHVKELKEDGVKAKVIARVTAKSRGLLGLKKWSGKCVPVKQGKTRGRVCFFRMKRKRSR